MTRRNHSTSIEVTAKVVVSKKVKVKSYKRVRNGKIEKVQAHHRRCSITRVENIWTVSK